MNPHNAVVANPTTENRQWFLIYAMLVAGKTAVFGAEKRGLLREMLGPGLPFKGLSKLDQGGRLLPVLRDVGTGRYRVLEPGFRALPAINVDTVTIPELMTVPGVGPKTANYFFMYGRKGEAKGAAAIDTHMKKFLRDCGLAHLKGYGTMQTEFVKRARILGMRTDELDNLVWRHFARKERTGYPEIMRSLALNSMAPEKWL